MAWFLFKLLGIPVAQNERLAESSIEWHPMLHPALLIGIGILLCVLTVWIYRKEDAAVAKWKRLGMAFLRMILFGLILLVMARPVLSYGVETSIRRRLAIVVDDSLSMSMTDPRREADDKKRAAIALGLMPLPPTTQAFEKAVYSEDKFPAEMIGKLRTLTRIEAVKNVLASPKSEMLTKLASEFDLDFYTISANNSGNRDVVTGEAANNSGSGSASTMESLRLSQWMNLVKPSTTATAIGDKLQSLISRTRGQPMAGIFLITDGGNNSGIDPMIAARMARYEGIPIYTYGVGITHPRDIIVEEIKTPGDVTFVDDQVPVTVRVKSQNLNGETGKLILRLNDKVVDSADIVFGNDQSDKSDQLVSLKFTPTAKGDFNLSASIMVRDDEMEKANNESAKPLRVVDNKIRVLLVERQPRWEFKYLMQQLLRDRRIDLRVLLLDGDPGISKGEKSPYVTEFPKLKAELHEKYDVLILGDVDPKTFSPQQLNNIHEFVTVTGGGLIMIAGQQFSPMNYAGTAIEKMLPVELEPPRATVGTGSLTGEVFDKPRRLELTAAGKRSEMLKLAEVEAESNLRWSQLPPVFWTARVGRIKPGAESLLADADPIKASHSEKMPVVALQQYGMGQVIYIGTDNTWRWQRNKGADFYVAVWGQMLQHLAMPHLLGSKRTQITADKAGYSVGDKITIYARLYNASYDPIIEPTVQGMLSPVDIKSGATSQPAAEAVILRPVANQKGMYKAEVIARDPGQYKFHIDKPADTSVKIDLSIKVPTVEAGDTAMNEPLLREIANVTDGKFFREENLWQLPGEIQKKNQKLFWPRQIELWSTMPMLLAMMTVACMEWLFRKLLQLK